MTTDICVLFTANDAYLHDFELFVPADCTAAVDDSDHRYALNYLGRVLQADTAPSGELIFSDGEVRRRSKKIS